MTDSKKAFSNTWEGVLEAAQAAGTRYPELVAAQWALESNRGQSVAARHNYFGLKGKGEEAQTTEFVKGVEVPVVDSFMQFDGLGESVAYLVSRWYLDFKSYQGVDRASSLNAAARALQKQGYATNPDYANRLIRIMNEQKSKVVKVEESEPEVELYKLVALQGTWLKKELKQASELGAKEKVEVKFGTRYGVVKQVEVAGSGHAQVTLAAGAGTWFVYEAHWSKVEQLGEAMPAEIDWSDFSQLVTPHLSVGEVLQWDKRRIPGPNSADRARLLRTAEAFEKVRVAWGKPLSVTSFYRPEPFNTEVGGVPSSMHISGEAMDLYPVDGNLEAFYQWIWRRWNGGLGDGRKKGFIHLDTRNGGGFVPGAGVRPAAEWLY